MEGANGEGGITVVLMQISAELVVISSSNSQTNFHPKLPSSENSDNPKNECMRMY